MVFGSAQRQADHAVAEVLDGCEFEVDGGGFEVAESMQDRRRIGTYCLDGGVVGDDGVADSFDAHLLELAGGLARHLLDEAVVVGRLRRGGRLVRQVVMHHGAGCARDGTRWVPLTPWF